MSDSIMGISLVKYRSRWKRRDVVISQEGSPPCPQPDESDVDRVRVATGGVECLIDLARMIIDCFVSWECSRMAVRCEDLISPC